MYNFTKHVIAAAIFSLGATSSASAGVSLNGPDLGGTRLGAQTEAFNPETVLGLFFGSMDESCMPTHGCPTNGPDLDGTRADAVAPKTFAAMSINGPDLDGTRVQLNLKANAEIAVPAKEYQGLGNCAPWECGVNGPDLGGTNISAQINAATPAFQPDALREFFGSMDESCMPTTGCPTNGPDLDGTRAGAVAPKTFAAMSINGPDLDGTRVQLNLKADAEIAVPAKEYHGIGNCEPWQCGVNGPDLSGARVQGNAQTENNPIEKPITAFMDVFISSYR